MIALTTSFFFIELVVGYVTNSMALVADSFHMLSDVVSIVIAFLSVKVCYHYLPLFLFWIITSKFSNADVTKEVV